MHNSALGGIFVRMPLPIRVLALRPGDRATLERWVRSRTTPQRLVERARLVLASADGLAGSAIVQRLQVSRPTVSRWLDRYAAAGLAGLLADKPRSGRPKRLELRRKPPSCRRRWERRRPMAARTGVAG